MKVIITKLQYQKILFNLLDTLYGPTLSYKQDDKDGSVEIFPHGKDHNDEYIFVVLGKNESNKGCKKELYFGEETTNQIAAYVPLSVMKKKLFSKTILSYVNKELPHLDIDCIDYDYTIYDNFGWEKVKQYSFNVKKNKKTFPKPKPKG